MISSDPWVKEVVLVGGGHAHVEVLRRWGMQGVKGARLTLISDHFEAPYSGMLPGYLAGRYSRREAHVDLRHLALFAGADFIRARVQGLDLSQKRVLLKDRPSLAYDVLSINTGSTPLMSNVPGASRFAVPIKPVDAFLAAWQTIEPAIIRGGGPFQLVCVGGGAGGVELCLALRERLRRQRPVLNQEIRIRLVTAAETIVPTHGARVVRRLMGALTKRQIEVVTHARVTKVLKNRLECEGPIESPIPYDRLLWVTSATPHRFVQESGLATDEKGFLSITETLQSASHENVFGAGDVATSLEHCRPKSGVYAVRQGRPLYENLVRYLTGETLASFRPQKRSLSLIGLGDDRAVVSWAGVAFEGRWVWTWKDWIDRRWMAKYRDLLATDRGAMGLAKNHDKQPRVPDSKIGKSLMRCGACGGKIGMRALRRALARLQTEAGGGEKQFAIDDDDAAIVVEKGSRLSLLTVDYFRDAFRDPYLLGRIGALHALNDVFAMGGRPAEVLAMVTLPYAHEAIQTELLYQTLSGARREIVDAGGSLAGGHSAEAESIALGFSVRGVTGKKRLVRKQGLQGAEVLVLTKGLGVGAILAADAAGRCHPEWYESALSTMLQSNARAAQILSECSPTAMTDISGFGLAGHLLEMLKGSNLGALLRLDGLPLVTGILECFEHGLHSSLERSNREGCCGNVSSADLRLGFHRESTLYDPQTAGPLLAAIPSALSESCLRRLHQAGYHHARAIGTITRDLHRTGEKIKLF